MSRSRLARPTRSKTVAIKRLLDSPRLAASLSTRSSTGPGSEIAIFFIAIVFLFSILRFGILIFCTIPVFIHQTTRIGFLLATALSQEERGNQSGHRAETIVRKNLGLAEWGLKSIVFYEMWRAIQEVYPTLAEAGMFIDWKSYRVGRLQCEMRTGFKTEGMREGDQKSK